MMIWVGLIRGEIQGGLRQPPDEFVREPRVGAVARIERAAPARPHAGVVITVAIIVRTDWYLLISLSRLGSL